MTLRLLVMSRPKTLACVGAAIAMSACGSANPEVSNAAPPVIVCGTTLSDGPAGAVVMDAVQHHQPITGVTIGGLLLIRVSESCKRGARVTWTPTSAATLVKQVRAKDGQPVVVGLRPTLPTARLSLTASRDGSTIAFVTVDLNG